MQAQRILAICLWQASSNPPACMAAPTIQAASSPALAHSRSAFCPRSPFSSAAVQNNQLVISWSSVPGGSYNVYSTTNLTFPFPSGWTSVAVSIPATGTKTTYTLPGTISDYAQLFLAIQQ